MGTITNESGDNVVVVIRRHVVDEVAKGKYTTACLSHMAHYDAAADCIIDASKRFGRSVSVVSVGCGDMWELRVLLNGRYVNKRKVLCSYIGVDIIDDIASPFGKKLCDTIDYTYVRLDLMDKASYPFQAGQGFGLGSMDVAICTEFIEHIDKESAQDVLHELAVITRPGGVLYLTTPNAINSKGRDKYHLYEWELDELLDELWPYWKIEKLHGTYINKRTFDKVNKLQQKVPQDFVTQLRSRFSSSWCRVICATPYPEYSEGVALQAVRNKRHVASRVRNK